MEVISREAAKAAGLKFFFTGKPCKNGHAVGRYVSTGKCTDCRSAVKKTYYRNNTEKVLSAAKVYKAGNPHKVYRYYNPEQRAAYYLANRDRILEWTRNRDPQIARDRVKKWRKDNPGKVAAQKRARELAKTGATPKWLTKEHKAQIATIYLQAQILTEATGVPYHVDHIIPINGENVCGLHVPWNLRVLKGEENLKKSNKVEGL